MSRTKTPDKYVECEPAADYNLFMISEEISFFNHGARLYGTLYRPADRRPCPVLVVLHAANGGERSYPFYQHLVASIPALGAALLLYDRRGSGQSEGQEPALYSTLAEDGAAAVDALRRHPGIDPQRIGLYGISQGGWLAPETAVLRPEVAFLVIVSGCAVPPSRQVDYAAAYNLRQNGFSEAEVEKALALRRRLHACYRGQVPRPLMAAELDQAQSEPWFTAARLDSSQDLPLEPTADPWAQTLDYNPLPAWENLHQPTLFIFADQDRWVPVAESLAGFRQASAHMPEVACVQIPGTDHLMQQTAGPGAGQIAVRYQDLLTAWLKKQFQ